MITPFDRTQLKNASYTFRLGAHGRILAGNHGPIDLRSTSIQYETIRLPPEGFELKPGDFILSATCETLRLGPQLCCLLSNRGKLAQIGLNVCLNSIFAEPSTNQNLILEIKNEGSFSVLLYPGMPVVKGIFLKLGANLRRDSYG